MGDLAHFLSERVYPQLDAVASGLLAELAPGKRQPSGAYPLRCPVCGVDRAAYYYPFGGSAVIVCNRRKHCGARVSVWRWLRESRSLSGRAVLQLLCKAAGVAAPEREARPAAEEAVVRAARVLQNMWRSHRRALEAFCDDRGLLPEDIRELGYGFYPSVSEVRDRLERAGVAQEVQRALGLLDRRLEGRVIGWWPQSDGPPKPWGYAPRVTRGDGPKYFYTPGLSRSVPYRLPSRATEVVAVEGPFDADALRLFGIPGIAVGGAAVTESQALEIARRGTAVVTYLGDADEAGRRGALESVYALTVHGIACRVGLVREGLDDADAVRQRLGPQGLAAIVADAVSAGVFVALQYCDAVIWGSKGGDRITALCDRIASALAGSDRVAYETTLRAVGIDGAAVDRRRMRAMRLGRLVEAGLSVDDASALVGGVS